MSETKNHLKWCLAQFSFYNFHSRNNFLNQDTNSGGISKSEGISSLFTKKEDFLNYNEFQLSGLGVLVQKRTYKKQKKLPLTNGDFLTVEAGKVITFFKYGDLIALQYKKKIFDPLIDPEHVCGIFKVFQSFFTKC